MSRLWQESRAVAKKSRDAAAVLFDLKFADNVHYNIHRAPNIKQNLTQNDAKWSFKVIQVHVFWSQWKGDKGNRLCQQISSRNEISWQLSALSDNHFLSHDQAIQCSQQVSLYL